MILGIWPRNARFRPICREKQPIAPAAKAYEALFPEARVGILVVSLPGLGPRRSEPKPTARVQHTSQKGPNSGYSAAWLARLTGGQKVAGSNPVTPTRNQNSSSRSFVASCFSLNGNGLCKFDKPNKSVQIGDEAQARKNGIWSKLLLVREIWSSNSAAISEDFCSLSSPIRRAFGLDANNFDSLEQGGRQPVHVPSNGRAQSNLDCPKRSVDLPLHDAASDAHPADYCGAAVIFG